MAGKKQKRMEQDPNAGERGKAKPKPRPGIQVNVDEVDLGGWADAFKVDAEQMERMKKKVEEDAARIADRYTYVQDEVSFGTGPKERGGNIYIDGLQEYVRRFGGSGFDASKIIPMLTEGLSSDMAVGEGQEPEQQMGSTLLAMAARVWEGPLGWQFMVGHNAGQYTFWFTAKFYDDEAETVLVEETLEITQESILRRTIDEFELDIERQMGKMQERLQADLAAFEED